jgi:H+/Cl- antiporter ClcA
MGLQNSHRDRMRFNHLNYRLKTALLLLAAAIVLVSIVLAIIIFRYVLDLAVNPLNAKTLIDQWASIFIDNPSVAQGQTSPFNGPSRWFAIVTLIALAYLLIRIPLLMLQMGTQLLIACQEDSRNLRSFVRQIMLELQHNAPAQKFPETPENKD